MRWNSAIAAAKRWHQFEIQTPRRGETVEECLLREAIHFDHPIDGRAGSGKCERPAGLTGDRHDAAVDVRCGAPVEAHLGVTHRATPFDRREIEIIEPDGSLQLVCTLARRKTMALCVSIRSTVAVPCADGAARNSMTSV